MSSERRIERHHLPYYLKVFNRFTDKPMGYIGNLSLEGLMLISPYPMLVNGRFDMRLKLPGQEGQLHVIDFQATCHWSREDVTPGSFDSGFSVDAPPAEFAEMIVALRHYFSFQFKPQAAPQAGEEVDSNTWPQP